VNTGFGRLASVRVADADLVQLQRNIVLSHAAASANRLCRRDPADDGAETRLAGAGRLGRASDDLALLEAMLARGVTPVVPAQGSVGAPAISRRWRT